VIEKFEMQGPNYHGVLSEEDEGGFFYQHRWGVPIVTVLLTNMFYVFSVKALIAKESMKGFEFIESTHSASYSLFSLLPFSESYYARLQLAHADPMPTMLVVHCHAFILLTSGLLLMLMLIKLRSLTQYIVEAKKLARTDLSRSHHLNPIRMSFMVLPCLFMFVFSTAHRNLGTPDLVLDGALLSAVSTPLLVYYGMCGVLLIYLSRNPGAEA